MASSLTGGGVGVSRFHQLFILSLKQGRKLPSEWAQYAWQILEAQGQKIFKNGQTLQTAEQNLAELNAQANDFEVKNLPILRALQVV